MKKLLIILILLISCTKPVIVIRSGGSNIYSAKAVTIKVDTTVNGVWDGGWKVLRIEDSRIRGTGTLTNWIIAASAWQQIFDSSINLGNIKIYDGGAFSAMWYGASPLKEDNWWYIQKSINIAKNNFPIHLPKGNYLCSKSLTASTIYKDNYVATKLDFYGDGDIWSNATTIAFPGNIWYGLGIQYAKGGSIHNLMLQGSFVSPINNGIPYFGLTDAQYADVSGRSGRNYSGFVIDPFSDRNTGGSTGLKVYDVWVSGFDILYNISPNGVTYNADILSFTNVRCGDGRIGFQSGQAQEKGNTITNIVSWGNLLTLVSIGNSGKFQAGSYTINGGNIAGNCIRLFDVKLGGWNPFYVNGLTAEGIATIGTVTSGDNYYAPIAVLNDLRIRFALPLQAGVQILFSANWPTVKISNSTLWYYGAPGEILHFSGKATMENNNYSGAVIWN